MDISDIRDKIIERGELEVAVENVQSLSKEAYALARKNYLGASDSSILCGVNLYKTLDELIKEKNCKFITEEERQVGEKPIVKKGYDLEPIILDKALEFLRSKQYKGTLYKPQDMFKFKYVDGLSVNYDGVFDEEDTNELFPVEAKLVSKYGEKYYNKNVIISEAKERGITQGPDLVAHIKRNALAFGIPAYYYTQVQQEIAGLDSKFGFLAALFDDTWTFKMFYIPRDNYVIDNIDNKAIETITHIKRDAK